MVGYNDYKEFLGEVGDFGVFAFDFSEGGKSENFGYLESGFSGFIVIQEGSAIQILDFEEHLLRKGRVLFLKKNQLYSWGKIDSLKGFMVLFTDDFFYPFSWDSGGDNLLNVLNSTMSSFAMLDDDKLAEWIAILHKMQKEQSQSDELSSSINRSYLCVLSNMFLRELKGANGVSSDKKKMIVDQFVRLVNDRYVSCKTPKEYAELLNITPNYLNSVCNEVLDKKAGQVIQERVVLEAKKLLSNSRITVSELAGRLGFVDNSYFGRYFKKASGLPPEQFRKNYTEF